VSSHIVHKPVLSLQLLLVKKDFQF